MKPEFLTPTTVGPPRIPFTTWCESIARCIWPARSPWTPRTSWSGLATHRRKREQCWDNIEAVLRFAGSSLANVVKMTIFLKDIRDASAETAVRRRRFAGTPLPACTQVQVANLGFPELLMEIDVIAVVSDG